MAGRVIVLNGGSSSGKTTLCRSLQAALSGTWFVLGIDTFLSAAPLELYERADGISFPGGGGVIVRGARFHELYGGAGHGRRARLVG